MIPLYYGRNAHGYSQRWVKKAKASMKSLMPRFNAQRMVMDYLEKLYGRATRQRAILWRDNCAPARELANWKQRIRQAWSGVSLRRLDEAPAVLRSGEQLQMRLGVRPNGLDAEDVFVECLVGEEAPTDTSNKRRVYRFTADGQSADGETVFTLDLQPPLSGRQEYRIRIYPHHTLLSRRFEMGCMLWL